MTQSGQGGVPEPGTSRPAGPEATPGYPEQAGPDQAYPEQGYAQSAYPGQAYGGQQYPEQQRYAGPADAGQPYPEQQYPGEPARPEQQQAYAEQAPQAGEPWGPPAYAYPQPEGYGPDGAGYGQPGRHAPQEYPSPPYGQPAYEPQPPQPGQPAYDQPPQGHVLGPGFEGPGSPHGYGYPPLPDAVTQYIAPVPAHPGEDATQFIPPVPAQGGGDAATQFIPPVPAQGADDATRMIPPVPAQGGGEDATQFIPPVPAQGADDATQMIPPVPPGPAPNAAEGFDGLFRGDADTAGHTQQLPPVREPVARPVPRRGAAPPPAAAQQFAPGRPHPGQPPRQQQQQYAPPPPPPPAPNRIPPAVIAAAVVGLAVAGLGVGALLGDGKAQNNDPGAVEAPASTGASASAAGEAPVDPARPQAVQLDKLLADSNDSRAAVIKAVEDIKVCKNLDQASLDLRDAARQRDGLVTRLQELKVDKLPDHARLTASLNKAWKASADADNSYADWADDVAEDAGGRDNKGDKGDKNEKGCKDGKAASTDNAADGNRSSGEATKSKESAAVLWNRIAAKYGLTQRDKSQL
ncbi:hypothetical protein [Streptomyces sp. NPDC001568]|uniref:hypothetical protein n=1 Tax=Streptomyces sp. NPDC001568 TaxID=3364588 RepID=UPI0036917168